MNAEITPTPPTPDLHLTERQLKRRRDVERLQQEGRACGAPPMGYKLTGKPGNRRLAPDEEQREIMAIVVRSRDEEGQSFDQASDTVEEYRASKEGRKPRSRGFRRGWSGRTCLRAYHAAKKLAEEGEPVPTHRRCSGCKESLPINRFTAKGKTCLTCRITRPLKKFEERVMGLTSANLIGKFRNGGRPLPASRQETRHRIQGALRNVMNLARRNPNSPELHEATEALATVLGRDLATNVPAEAMNESQLQDELRRQLRRELRPLLLEVQAEAAMLESNDATDKVEP